MSKEIEEIKKILINHDSSLKDALDIGLVDSKSVYDLEEFIDETVKITDLDIMDVVLIIGQLQKLEEKKFKMLKESEGEQQRLSHERNS